MIVLGIALHGREMGAIGHFVMVPGKATLNLWSSSSHLNIHANLP